MRGSLGLPPPLSVRIVPTNIKISPSPVILGGGGQSMRTARGGLNGRSLEPGGDAVSGQRRGGREGWRAPAAVRI
jgi:hypothetical protein